MPLPKCAPDDVYDKKSKKCIKIGSNAYKSILTNNPDAFKHYALKIKKATKTAPTCSSIQVYNKYTKRCVAIGGQSYHLALKKYPTVFGDQKNKITTFFKKPNYVANQSPSETLANIMKKMIPSPIKTVSTITKKKVLPPSLQKSGNQSEKLLIKIPEKKVIIPQIKASSQLKQFFMKKSKDILKKSDYKTKNVMKYTNTSKLPPYIFIQKPITISLYYFDYYGEMTVNTFNPKRTLKRNIMNLTFMYDNISSNFYKHVLRQDTNPDIIDVKWYIKMQEYISTLPNRERFALYAYTKNGDVYVNMLERGFDLDYTRVIMKPLFYEFLVYMTSPDTKKDIFIDGNNTFYGTFGITIQDLKIIRDNITSATAKLIYDIYKKYITLKSSTIKKDVIHALIKSLSDTISRVIKKSPPTTKTMVVFRGVKDCFFAADNFDSKYSENEVFYNKGFVSTTLDYKIAVDTFSGQEQCCFKVLTILPGTRCIPLIGLTEFAGEVEILLDRNTKYIIRDKYKTQILKRPRTHLTNTPNERTMKISDIIIG